MVTAIQNRDEFSIKLLAGGILTKLTNKGLIKVLGGVSEKHLAEDEIFNSIRSLLEKGISDYDAITVAQCQINFEDDTDPSTACKHTDNVWRLEIEVNDNRYLVDKSQVIELAIKAYKAELEQALIQY